MEKEEKTISGEELIKKIDAEIPRLQEEVNKFLDSIDGKYHCMTVAQVICNTADMFHVGYNTGYMNGKCDLIDEQRVFLKELAQKNKDVIGCSFKDGYTLAIMSMREKLTDTEYEITGIEGEVEKKSFLPFEKK